MSAENVEIVRRMYEAFHAGDIGGALAFFDPGVIFDASIRVDGGVGHGREELAAMAADWVGGWERWRETIEDMHDFGDQVCVVTTQRGRGKGSGIELEDRYVTLYEIEGDRINKLTLYKTTADALAAAGLSE
jgi:ketosteroid isomerase-like protein